MQAVELSPMEYFAVDLMTRQEWITPHELKHAWCEALDRRKYGSSRDQFGNTSAAYLCLYRLVKKGVAIKESERYDIYFKLTTVPTMKKKKQTSTRGGAREGAGARAKSEQGNRVLQSYRISPENIAYLATLPHGAASDFVNTAIETCRSVAPEQRRQGFGQSISPAGARVMRSYRIAPENLDYLKTLTRGTVSDFVNYAIEQAQ